MTDWKIRGNSGYKLSDIESIRVDEEFSGGNRWRRSVGENGREIFSRIPDDEPLHIIWPDKKEQEDYDRITGKTTNDTI